MVSHIITTDGITLFLGAAPTLISDADPNYERIVKAVNDGADADAINSILFEAQQQLTKAVQLTDDITIEGGVVLYKGHGVAESLSERIIEQHKQGFALEPMLRFLENLMQNPSSRAVNHLYSFLEKGRNPITEDGCFLAYKKVRHDYQDIFTGTMDNSVGAVVEMVRNMVDDDPNRTCSHGLHACSFDYLGYYAAASNDRVMAVKVNPKDVVAIPRDYNDTKMRACRYEVVAEYTEYFQARQDRLAEMQIAAGSVFTVQVLEDGEWTLSAGFETLSEAEGHAEAKREEGYSWRIVNNTTGRAIQSRVYPRDEHLVADMSDYEDDDIEGDDDVEDDAEERPFRVLGYNRGQEGIAHDNGAYETFDDALEHIAENARFSFSSHVTVVDGSGTELARVMCAGD